MLGVIPAYEQTYNGTMEQITVAAIQAAVELTKMTIQNSSDGETVDKEFARHYAAIIATVKALRTPGEPVPAGDTRRDDAVLVDIL